MDLDRCEGSKGTAVRRDLRDDLGPPATSRAYRAPSTLSWKTVCEPQVAAWPSFVAQEVHMAEVKELQHADRERFWHEFAEVMGGPDGLMTYRYLGTHAEASDRHHATGRMRLRSDLRGPAGLHAAPLLILVADTIGILDDAIAVPAPVHFDLAVLDGGDGVEEVRCIGEMVHEGRSQLFSVARIVDAADESRVLAIARDSGVVMAPAPAGYHYVEPGPGMADSPTLPPLWEAFSARRRPDGRLEIPELNARIGSTSGSLHHGPTQVVLEAAATEAAVAAAGTDRLRIRQWYVAFTARGRSGPFVAAAEVVSDQGTVVAVDSSLMDEGAGRLIASASAVFERA
jgi:acyl-coenzyme A thioesterase PaaI-like protein